jgi:hypothetical protein
MAPEDSIKSAAIAKYMFHFFEEIGGGNPLIAEKIGAERNIEYEFEVNGLTVKQSFYLAEDIIDEPMTDGVYGGWKIRLKQSVSNRQRYGPKIEEMYTEHIGGSASTLTEKYNTFVDLHKNNPDSTDYMDWYNELPPADYYKTTLLKKYAYAFCYEEDIASSIYYSMHSDISAEGEDPEFVKYWSMDTYKSFNTLRGDEESEYFASVVAVDTPQSVHIPSETDSGFYLVKAVKKVTVEIRKKINNNSYKRFIYTAGKLKYDIDDHIAKVDHDTADSSFRIFMLDGYLRNRPFKEYTSLYDESMVGLAYSHVSVYVKWYQRNGFRFIVQVVLIIIAIFTYGSTSYLIIIAKMALAYAISKIAMKLSEYVGGDLGVILGVIFALVAFYFTGTLDTNSTIGAWLKVADMYLKLESQKQLHEADQTMKALRKLKKEMNRKMIELRQAMEATEYSGMDRAVIIAKIADEMEVDDSGFFNEELVSAVEEQEWKLNEVKPVDYNQAETLYNRTVNIPRDVYEFEHNMIKIEMFGVNDDQ